MIQSSNNSPINNQRQPQITSKIQPQTTVHQQQKTGSFVSNMGNSRTMANSMNVSPVKQKANMMNMANSFKQTQSKHPILANKQSKL